MVEIKDEFGTVIHRGRNLRILRDYISGVLKDYSFDTLPNWPIAIGCKKINKGEGMLHIHFKDRSYCDVRFADFGVMLQTVKNWRNLRGVRVVIENAFPWPAFHSDSSQIRKELER